MALKLQSGGRKAMDGAWNPIIPLHSSALSHLLI